MALARSSFRLRCLASICLFFGTLTIIPPAAPAQTAQPPATILILRHAEKLTDGRSDLSSDGYARAALLPQMFSGTGSVFPTPQVIFAAHESRHSNRSVQTARPLAAALHLTIDDQFEYHDYEGLAAALLSGKYAGKIVLVVWHRGSIPRLATALGVTPPYDPWPEKRFDRIWRIDYRDGKATIKDLPYGTPQAGTQ